jgi:hypothetical protein
VGRRVSENNCPLLIHHFRLGYTERELPRGLVERNGKGDCIRDGVKDGQIHKIISWEHMEHYAGLEQIDILPFGFRFGARWESWIPPVLQCRSDGNLYCTSLPTCITPKHKIILSCSRAA